MPAPDTPPLEAVSHMGDGAERDPVPLQAPQSCRDQVFGGHFELAFSIPGFVNGRVA